MSRNALSLKRENRGRSVTRLTTAAKETTVSVALMHFISSWKYLGNRDSRSYNICVSSDKLGCFLSFCDIFVFWKLCYVSDKNENIKCTNCPTSTHPAKNITLACWVCLCFWLCFFFWDLEKLISTLASLMFFFRFENFWNISNEGLH